MFEVTTFRRDIQPLGRRAIVEFADSLDEDLARRDFTLNAVAWHPVRGEIRDPFNGSRDLRDNVLRAVGVPSERFREDYLRILRGLRFAGKMDLDIEFETWGAMIDAVDGLGTLSMERVREELMKVMSATPRPSGTFALYGVSGALAVVMPELDSTRADPNLWTDTLISLDAVGVSDPVLRVAALLAPVARLEGVQTVLALLHRLRFSNAASERIAACTAPPWDLPLEEGEFVGDRNAVEARTWAASSKPIHRTSRLRLAIARTRAARLTGGATAHGTANAVRKIRAEVQSGHALTLRDLAVDGNALIRLGLPPGPALGDTLDELLQRVLVDPSLNSRDRLLAIASEVIARSDG